MALNRNLSGYDITMQNYFAEIESKLGKKMKRPGRSAFCQARQKLEWTAFEFLMNDVNRDDHFKSVGLHQWHGHTVRAVDGTWLTIPLSKDLLEAFPQHVKNGEHTVHYPTAQLVTAINVETGQVSKAAVGKYGTSERVSLLSFIEDFSPGDIVLLDRGFFSHEVIKRIDSSLQFFVVRLMSSSSLYKKIIASGKSSIVTEYEGLKIRVIKSEIISLDDGKPVVIATNFLEKNDDDLLELYKRRWNAETLYGRIKNLLNIEHFHSRTVNGIYQEIYAHLFIKFA